MKKIASVLSILSPVRFLVVAFTCALLLLSSAFPAFAIDSYQSDPTEATTQLLDIQRKTDEAAKEPPEGLKKTQKETNEGLNEVQGAADIDKQKRPENSQAATSVEENIKNALEKVTGK
ncbi:hypothetical protein [uncultured Nostoc sp.]|uniref:hypothetical protein n=1 Tax=uncultured Nostoc sp. TaxID=340711 RepID=UPI0035CB44E6